MSHLSQIESETLRSRFFLVDTDGSGTLDLSEFQEYLSDLVSDDNDDDEEERDESDETPEEEIGGK